MNAKRFSKWIDIVTRYNRELLLKRNMVNFFYSIKLKPIILENKKGEKYMIRKCYVCGKELDGVPGSIYPSGEHSFIIVCQTEECRNKGWETVKNYSQHVIIPKNEEVKNE